MNSDFKGANRFPVLDCLKLIALLASFVNVIIFARLNKTHCLPLLQYLLVMSICDAVYTLSLALTMPLAVECTRQREQHKSANTSADLKICQVFSFYLYLVPEYLTSCLALFNICVEIVITAQRMRLISTQAASFLTRKSENKQRVLFVCVLLFICVIGVYSPVLVINKVSVVETGNKTSGAVRRDYFFSKTKFGRTIEAKLIEKLLAFIRVGLVMVLTVVNVIASVQFTSFFKRKHALKEIIRGLIL
jgi:hypothetical protein